MDNRGSHADSRRQYATTVAAIGNNSTGSRRMLADTATVGGWTAAIKVLGAVKVILGARLFGAGDAMDAFLIAFLLPSFFADVLAGPLDAALIPQLVTLREEQGSRAAAMLASSVAWTAAVALFVAALAAALASPWFLPGIASGFAPEKLAFTERMLLAMLAIVPLGALSVTWRAVLNSERRFALAAVLPAITPAVSIAALLFFGKKYGVESLAFGTVAGSAIEAVASGFGAGRAAALAWPTWQGMINTLRPIAAQYTPLSAMALVIAGAPLIDQAMAARLGSGSVAAYSYGTRLLGVLLAIGPAAVGTVVLPNISSRRGASVGLRSYGLTLAAVILPAIGVLMYFSPPIIRIVFEKGAFTASAVSFVADVQRMSLLQVPFAMLLALEIRVVAAARTNNLLYRVAALSLALTFALDLIAMRWRGVIGIVIAGAIVRLVSSLYLSCKIRVSPGAKSGLTANNEVS